MTNNHAKSEKELLQEISDKLDSLIGLAAIQGLHSKDEIVKVLVSQGFSNSKIGLLTGIPKGTIDGIRAKMAKSRRR